MTESQPWPATPPSGLPTDPAGGTTNRPPGDPRVRWLAGVVVLFRRAGARPVLLLAGIVLGGLALSRFENVSPAPADTREKMLRFVESTYEP